MKLEHFALQVNDPNAMAAWYVEHLHMRVRSRQEASPFTYFLEESSGGVLFEFYGNPAHPVPDYASFDPLLLHLAFVSAEPLADADRLVAAGARYLSKVERDDGTLLVMLRDPWGLPLQLCRRAVPFFPVDA
jgi:catechol 2,3-dioxygenase-like lactoylglutathione lyase family enzyme